MPLFGPPNVRKLEANKDLRGLIKALRYKKDEDVRVNAARALGQIGGARAVRPLTKALADNESSVRREATKALGQIGDPQAVEALAGALEDGDSWVRREAAEALGKIGDPRAVEALAAALDDSDSQVRVWAASSLKQIGDQRAAEALLGALDHEDSWMRARAASALEQMGVPLDLPTKVLGLLSGQRWEEAAALGEAAVEPLVVALESQYLVICQGAAKALGQIGDPRATKGLIAALGPHDALRIAASEALEKMDDPQVVELLINALAEGQETIRAGAARTMGKIGDARAIEPLGVALRDPDGEVCWAAAEALQKIEHPRVVLTLIVALREGNPQTRESAAKALEQSGVPLDPAVEAWSAVALGQWEKAVSLGEHAVEPLSAALRDGAQRTRQDAAEALGKIGDPRGVDPLIEVLEDDDEKLREAAVEALSKVRGRRARAWHDVATREWKSVASWGKAATEPLLRALQNDERGVRQRAAKTLEKIGDPAAVEPLVAALQDEDAVVGRLAAGALGKIGDPRALEPLVAALQDEDPQLRSAAATALGSIGDPQALEPLVAALQDEKPEMRREAAMALGSIGDPLALEPLSKVLTSGTEHTDDAAAARALGMIGDARAVEVLLEALGNSNYAIAAAAAEALGGIKDPRVLDPLIDALEHDNGSVREAAAEALGRVGDPRAIGPLGRTLRELGIVARAAAKALDQIGLPADPSLRAWQTVVAGRWEEAASLGEAALEPLSADLWNWSRTVPVPTGIAMALRSVIAKLDRVPESKLSDMDIRQRAVEALARSEALWAVSPLIGALKEKPLPVRKSAAMALVKLYQSRALDEEHKAQILRQREAITLHHQDRTGAHYDRPALASDCHIDDRSHTDVKGPGVDFPI